MQHLKMQVIRRESNTTVKLMKTNHQETESATSFGTILHNNNIGRVFLNLLDKHFHKEHKLNKIFNRNSVKVSHSCARNIEHIIKIRNRKITESYIEKSAEASCNCKDKNKCPFEGNCLTKNIVYMATVETETNTSSYVGMTGNSFKTRYYNHLKSFKNKHYKNETELSNYI